jgi:hypothetical protein
MMTRSKSLSRTETHLFILLLLGGLVLIAGCSDSGDDPGGNNPVSGSDSPTWDDDVGPLLAVNCSSCHGGSSPQSGFSVDSYATVIQYQTSSGNPAVDPGNPEGSELLQRLEGDGFSRMPPTGSLETTSIQLVQDWIAAGAPESVPEE